MIEDHKVDGDPLRTPAKEEPEDAADRWGRRVGRALGLAFAIFLVWQLLSTYVVKPA